MGLPRKLKDMNLFVNGDSYQGQCASVTRPKLARKMEEWRGAGMDGAVQIDMGQEPLDMEFKIGGYGSLLYSQFGIAQVDGVQLRWMGAYQSDDDGGITAVEILARGRFPEMDPGESKVGDATEETFKFIPVYYRQVENGRDVVEVDILNMICKVNGIDRLANLRAAIGL